MLETKSGTSDSGEWSVQGWVLETDGQYPKKISFEAMNKHFDLKVGQIITAHINLESREWEGRWFLSAKAWKIDFDGTQSAPPPPPTDIPPAPTKTEAPSKEATEPIETDDLPF